MKCRHKWEDRRASLIVELYRCTKCGKYKSYNIVDRVTRYFYPPPYNGMPKAYRTIKRKI